MAKTRAIRPTRKQKELLKLNRLVPENWLVVNEQDGMLNIINKTTQKVRSVKTMLK